MYVSRWLNEQYSAPENLGAMINSKKSEYDPCISREEALLVFTSANREDTFGKGDLYVSKLNDNKNWLQAINLGRSFNTEAREYCAYFSSDSKYFFFSSEGDVKWIDAQVLKNQVQKISD